MHKQKYAKWLLLQSKEEKDEQRMLTKEQILAVLELTKVMGLISCQQSVERRHQMHFEKLIPFSLLSRSSKIQPLYFLLSSSHLTLQEIFC